MSVFKGGFMQCRVICRLLVEFFLLLISVILFISCVASTNVTTGKEFEKQKNKIVIMPFMNSGFKSGYDPFLSDKLAYALIEKKFAVMDRQKVQNIFSALKLEPSGMLSKSDLNDIGNRSGVDILCTGTVYYQTARGGIWPHIITVRCADVKSGEAVFVTECKNSADWEGSSCMNEIFDEMNKIAK